MWLEAAETLHAAAGGCDWRKDKVGGGGFGCQLFRWCSGFTENSILEFQLLDFFGGARMLENLFETLLAMF